MSSRDLRSRISRLNSSEQNQSEPTKRNPHLSGASDSSSLGKNTMDALRRTMSRNEEDDDKETVYQPSFEKKPMYESEVDDKFETEEKVEEPVTVTRDHEDRAAKKSGKSGAVSMISGLGDKFSNSSSKKPSGTSNRSHASGRSSSGNRSASSNRSRSGSSHGGSRGGRPMSAKERRARRRRRNLIIKMIIGLAVIIAIIIAIIFGVKAAMKNHSSNASSVSVSELSAEAEEPVVYDLDDEDVESFDPHCVDETDPSNLIEYTEVQVDGNVVDDYEMEQDISFTKGSDYTSGLEGIFCFRGNNFRNNPTYGYADFTNDTLETVWSADTNGLTANGKTWTGNGWTGQPLMRKWTKAEKEHMNMYDWAKEDDDLVEVIYASLDGYIYFLDLETGEPTRDAMNTGFVFKGAGSLDPRGYPILYVGAGYNGSEGHGRIFIINLIDCTVMETFGNDDAFALRNLSFFDSSSLVDAETDTLINPGENGILYLVHLNTEYDEEAGTLSIDPEYVKWHYQSTRSLTGNYWLGMEDSCAVYEGYLYIADNGGNLMCLNLKTLELVWVQDVLDDTNDSPVLSVENGKLYLYISTSFHYGWRSYNTATIPIWKIDAETGEIVWQTDYECYTVEDVSGGVQSTIALGKNSLEDYIYVTVSRTGSAAGGVLSCLNKEDGNIEWEQGEYYAWSSPVCVYNEDGVGRVIYADSSGKMYLINGETGEELSQVELSEGVIEASPAVYNDMIVVGTRACKIWGIQIE